MMNTTTYLDGRVTLHGGDCRDAIRTIADASIDSVVCDPPYALVSIVKRFGAGNAAPAKDGDVYARSSAGFMGKQWDTGETAFAVEFWAEVLRVLKPGGHVVAFSGTRTYHRLACAIEDAGFEIRDQLAWCYGTGFPKSHDVSKGIAKRRDDSLDVVKVTSFLATAAKVAGRSRADVDEYMGTSDMGGWWLTDLQHRCALPTFEQWLALKEFIGFGDEFDAEVMRLNARKGERGEAWKEAAVIGTAKGAANGSVVGLGLGRSMASEYEVKALDGDAAAWKGWGTALKPAWEPIVLARKPLIGTVAENVLAHGTGAINVDGCRVEAPGETISNHGESGASKPSSYSLGARVALQTAGQTLGRWPANIVHDGSDEVLAEFPKAPGQQGDLNPTGRSRPSKTCFGDMAAPVAHRARNDSGSAARFFYSAKASKHDRAGSKHPTVKPVNLMRWLCRMVTPPGGVVLDPFAGSGTTGAAAYLEGFKAVLCEREEEYQRDIATRLSAMKPTPEAANDNAQIDLFGEAA